VGVAVADMGQPVVVGEADDTAMPRLAEAGRVERLETVGPGGRIRVVEEAAQHPALGAERIWDQGWAGMARPPASCTARIDVRSER
jgi:hypothetical protein